MKNFNILLARSNVNYLAGEILFIAVRENERPLRGLTGFIDWKMSGFISDLMMKKYLTGKAEEKLLFHTRGKIRIPRVVIVGMGGETLQPDQFKQLGRFFYGISHPLNVRNISIGLDTIIADNDDDPVPKAVKFVEGFCSFAPLDETTVNIYASESLFWKLQDRLPFEKVTVVNQ